MIQVNRIYLIFNRLVTKKFLVDTSDKISNLQLDQNFSDKFFLSEYPTKESFNNLMLTVLKNILP